MSNNWSPDEYILGGRFATRADIDSALDELAATTGGPILLVTYCADHPLPSLSKAWAPDLRLEESDHVRRQLMAALEDGALGDAVDKGAVVEQVAVELLRRLGVSAPDATHFGSPSDRPGDLAVALVAASTGDPAERMVRARDVALRALSSGPAAFHRENAHDLAIRNVYRQAQDTFRPDHTAGGTDLSDIANVVSRERVGRVLARAHEILGVSGIVVYETQGIRLDLFESSAGRSGPAIAPTIWIDDEAKLPLPPELGWSAFDTLSNLINLAWVSNRRYFGVIQAGWQAVAWPFGGSRPVAGFGGVVAVYWPNIKEPPFGSQDMSRIQAVVRHLERALSDLAKAGSVATVAAELRRISESVGADASVPEQLDAPALGERLDLRLTYPTIRDLLCFLADLTGSASATCRILTGVEGPPFARGLVRVDCEGVECASVSPETIFADLDRKSVNAWVAVNGQPVYLRRIPVDSDEPPADLARYPGLEHASLFSEGIQSELCVPIFAEGRLVGTINLEAKREYAYDLTAELVAECAQVIGLALLESRRRIGVELMVDAGGLLDKRHELERMVRELGDELNRVVDAEGRPVASIARSIEELVDHIYLHQRIELDHSATKFTVRQAIHKAMDSISWTYSGVALERLAFGDNSGLSEVLERTLEWEHANALKFAVAQTLVNTRVRGQEVQSRHAWPYLVKLRLKTVRMGGRENVYLGLSSRASTASVKNLHAERVFREPITMPGDQRTRIGAFIAGEILRRYGGSAYLRVDPLNGQLCIVTAELSVPLKEH